MTDDAATARGIAKGDTDPMTLTWFILNLAAMGKGDEAHDAIAAAIRSARADERARCAGECRRLQLHNLALKKANPDIAASAQSQADGAFDCWQAILTLSSAPARDAPAETKCSDSNCADGYIPSLPDGDPVPCPKCMAPARAVDADRALGANVRALVERGLLGRIYKNTAGGYVVQELGARPIVGAGPGGALVVVECFDAASLDEAIAAGLCDLAAAGKDGA